MANYILPIPGVGDDATAPAAPVPTSSLSINLNGWLSRIGAALAAYHGYKRNGSIGWALAWGAAGAFAPIITNAIGFAQGYSKPKGAP